MSSKCGASGQWLYLSPLTVAIGRFWGQQYRQVSRVGLSMIAGEQCPPGADSQLVLPSPVRGECGVRGQALWGLRPYIWDYFSEVVNCCHARALLCLCCRPQWLGLGHTCCCHTIIFWWVEDLGATSEFSHNLYKSQEFKRPSLYLSHIKQILVML